MTEYVDTVVLEDEFLAAASELRIIAAEKKHLTEREAECKRIIEKILSVGDRGISPDGEEMVAIRKGAARFKPELAMANLPNEVLQSILVLAPDAKRAKAILAPALYAMCTEENKPSVVAL